MNSDIMKLKGQEDGDMEHGMYTKTEIDLKLDKISSDTQHGFEKVDLKNSTNSELKCVMVLKIWDFEWKNVL